MSPTMNWFFKQLMFDRPFSPQHIATLEISVEQDLFRLEIIFFMLCYGYRLPCSTAIVAVNMQILRAEAEHVLSLH